MANNNKEAKVKFTAETSEFSKGIANLNKSLGNLKSDLKLVNTEIKANGTSFDNLSNKQKTLQGIVSDLSSKLELQGNKLESAKRLFGENSDEVNRLYRGYNNIQAELVKFTRELKDTDDALEKMGNEAKDAAKDIDKLDNEMDDAEGGSKGLKGVLEGLKGGFDSGSIGAVGLGTALGNLASEAITMAIDAIKEFCQYLWDLPEATKEFESNMAKLSGSTKQYGYNTEATNKKVKELYGYFEDEQVAVNAITNLQGIGLSQEDLNKVTDAAIATWTAYGDSIPIESLTESINETSKVGKVTGSLADALNWAKISEDDFNKELEKCKTTQERAQLITKALNGEYGESKKVYDETTKSSRKLTEAQFDLKETEDELSDEIEPLKTGFQEFKNKVLEKMIPVVEKVVDWFSKFSDWCKKLADKIKELKNSELGKFLDSIVKILGLAVWQTFKLAIEGIKLAIEGVIEAFKFLADVLEPVFEDINDFIDDCKPVVEGFIEGFKEGFEDIEEVAGPVQDAFDALTGALSDLFDTLSDAIGLDELGEGLSGAEDNANSLGKIIGGTLLGIIKSLATAFVLASSAIQGVVIAIKPLIQALSGDFKGALESAKNVPKDLEKLAKDTGKTIEDLYKKTDETTDNIEKDCKDFNPKMDNMKNVPKAVKESMSESEKESNKGLDRIGTSIKGWKPIWKISKPDTKDAEGANTNMLTNMKNKITGWKPIWKVNKPDTKDAEGTNTNMLTNMKNKLTGWTAKWKISNPNTKDAVSHVKTSYSSKTFDTNVKGLIKTTKDSLSSRPAITSQAKMTSCSQSFSRPTITTKANMSSYSQSFSRPTITSQAKMTSWTKTFGTPTISIIGKISSWIGGKFNADGAVYQYHARGGIMTSPTVFHIGGEAGAEAILPLNGFYAHLDSKLEQIVDNDSSIQLNRIYSLLAQMELRLDIDGREFTRTAIAPNSGEIDAYNSLRRSGR